VGQFANAIILAIGRWPGGKEGGEKGENGGEESEREREGG
jgi:hypothetical protein